MKALTCMHAPLAMSLQIGYQEALAFDRGECRVCLNVHAEQQHSTCLEVRAAVVDDDVGDGLQIAVVQRAQALAQLALGAVRAVEVVQVARQVTLPPIQRSNHLKMCTSYASGHGGGDPLHRYTHGEVCDPSGTCEQAPANRHLPESMRGVEWHLGADAVTGWRQPQAGDAAASNVACLVH